MPQNRARSLNSCAVTKPTPSRTPLLLTVSDQLGVAFNVHVNEANLRYVAPALGWR